ncbi:MAG: hypothetical protein KH452_08275 [Clostridiales bacterium]|nr:hypothetical protein [Clostridiales bacterium]
MMGRTGKYMWRGLAFLLACTLFVSQADMTVLADETGQQVIPIKSEEDFLLMAEQCRTEGFSGGKIFRLDSDLDLSEYENRFVPVMDGTFDGNGHRITGISLNEEMSDYGLFRYVGANGVLRNLEVEGEVLGGEEQENTGILAGSNAGKIINCTSKGTLNGQTATGGIAGKNEVGGTISRSGNEALVDGRLATGGIVGCNEGTVTDCTNLGNINTSQKVKKEMDGDGTLTISIPHAVAGLSADERANETGGIAGNSSGRIAYCINEGTIGYEHLGYAAGGIVGRQSGAVSYCENHAVIYGRKDVGGIVGYFDPYEAVSYDRDISEELSGQLDDLADMLDDLGNAGDTLGDHLSGQVDLLSGQLKSLKSSLRGYLDHYEDMAENSKEAVSSQIDSLKGTIDGMQYDFGMQKIQAHRDQIEKDIARMQELIGQLRAFAEAAGGEQKEQLEELLAQYEEQIKELEQTLVSLKNYIADHPDAEESEEPEAPEESEEPEESETPEEPEESEKPEAPEVPETPEIPEEPEEPEEPLPDGEMQMMSFSAVTESADISGQLGVQAAAAMEELKALAEDVQLQLQGIVEALEGIPGEAEKLHQDFQSIGRHMDELTDTFQDELDDWGDELDTMREDLQEQGDGITERVDTAGDTLDADWDEVSSRIDRIKDQFDSIRATVSDGLDELKGRIEDRTVYVDVSELASEGTGDGKIVSCTNDGEIYSDSQGGGIAGSIQKDSQEQVTGWLLNTEETKEDGDEKDSITKHVIAAVFDCVNTGEVSVKNDYAGGIVGKAAYGIIVRSENYGDVISEDGRYAGGIAGLSEKVIRDCYVLCGLDAEGYAGGAAGKAEDISGCYICSYMDMDAWVSASGAVAGKAEGTVEGNYFVDNGCGAVDGVTRTQEASAVDYASMLELKEMPENFRKFTVRFMDGEEIVWQETFAYGEGLSPEDYPKLQGKEGGYAYWEKKDLGAIHRNVTVHAVYRAYIPSLEAGGDTGHPEVLLGGDFYPDSVFTVREASADEQEQIRAILESQKKSSHYQIRKVYVYELSQEEALPEKVSLRVRDDRYLADCLLVTSDTAGTEDAGNIRNAEKIGSYLAVETGLGSTGYVVVLDRVENWMIIAGAVFAVIFAGALTGLLVSRKKKKKAEAECEEKKTEE